MPKINGKNSDILWARVDAVVSLILENDRYMQSKRNAELTDLVSEKFDISIRQAQRYIAEAKKEIKRLSGLNKEENYAKAIRDREYLYHKAITPSFIFNKDAKDKNGNYIMVSDLKLALEVAKDRDKILGLYEDKITLEGNVNNHIDFSGIKTEDILSLINELKKSQS